MNNMTVRALSGAVYIGIIVACLLLGGYWFCGLCAVFALLGLNEMERLLNVRIHFTPTVRILDFLLAVALLSFPIAVMYNSLMKYPVADVLLGLWITYIIAYIPLRMTAAVFDKEGGHAAGATMGSVFSIFYTTLPLIMLMGAYSFAGWKLVMATFVMIWLNDTGAYLSGRTWGKTKLCERLSPKKTWEGFWGGFALCVVAGVAYPLIFMPGTSAGWVVAWGIYGAVVSVASTVGDLFESLIKRTLGVKDSGNLIPGHGGILDRIDSLLAVAPLTLFFALVKFLF